MKLQFYGILIKLEVEVAGRRHATEAGEKLLTLHSNNNVPYNLIKFSSKNGRLSHTTRGQSQLWGIYLHVGNNLVIRLGELASNERGF